MFDPPGPSTRLLDWIDDLAFSSLVCAAVFGLGGYLLLRAVGISDGRAHDLAVAVWALSTPIMLGLGRLSDRQPGTTVSHGSAAFMGPAGRRRLTGASGLVVGRDPSSGKLLRYQGPAHLVTIAPTRSGKGVGAVVPNLLTYEGAVVCIDPKGENARVTAAARRRFGPVWVIDPFGVTGLAPVTYNPLDSVDGSEIDAGDAAGVLADALVFDPAEQVGDAHWNEEARALIAGLILYGAIALPPPERTLATLRHQLTLGAADFHALLKRMADHPCPLVARAAHRQLGKADREAAGVLSSAQRHTHFLDSARLTAATAQSDFSLKALGGSGGTLYLVLPPDRLSTHGRWLRLIIAQALTSLAQPGAERRRPVLFLLDELAALGRLEPVAQAMSLMAGYGVQLWAIFQDLHQLRAAYGRQAGTFLSNAGCLQIFNVNDLETADWVSRLIGDTSAGEGADAWEDDRSGAIYAGPAARGLDPGATLRRPLLAPDEVRRLPDDALLLFMSGCAPILGSKVRYYADPEFARSPVGR